MFLEYRINAVGICIGETIEANLKIPVLKNVAQLKSCLTNYSRTGTRNRNLSSISTVVQ